MLTHFHPSTRCMHQNATQEAHRGGGADSPDPNIELISLKIDPSIETESTSCLVTHLAEDRSTINSNAAVLCVSYGHDRRSRRSRQRLTLSKRPMPDRK
eukprot:6433929-Prymnesium_polylepis.1